MWHSSKIWKRKGRTRGGFGTAYGHVAVIRNINLHTGTRNDFIDRLAALSDYISDFFRIDLKGNNLRRIRPYLFSRLRNRRCHDLI